jgi:hypothetical protein
MSPDPTDARKAYRVERKPFPPLWADFVLRRLVLARQNRDAVSGDLLEEYREVIVPERGQRRADRWYVAQVAGYVVRSNLVWAVLFSAAYLARQAYDWFVPTTDFHLRAEVTTYTAVSLLLGAGFWAACRSGSTLSGVIAGMATTAIAAVFSLIGGALLLAGWHDPATLAMIRNSGGIEEVFLLPIFAIGLGLVLGTVGGAVGASARKIRRITVG